MKIPHSAKVFGDRSVSYHPSLDRLVSRGNALVGSRPVNGMAGGVSMELPRSAVSRRREAQR